MTSNPEFKRQVRRTLRHLNEIQQQARSTGASADAVLSFLVKHRPDLVPQFTLLKEAVLHTRHSAEHAAPPAREALLQLLRSS